ncbi:hypothetical protein Ga0074115_10846 [endosymbiont of Ridgeia piscesae]|jgi:phospholipid/cholesterol/gamma-HCH transport system ATP-binding protein|uniref:ABC transporter n=1 Tax=endosymbiont of Ridgeia piscesae TaxID=54398 RepID=A0A0T5ZAX4_9GAMM|nr:hypothetical protein [endosymbiont of Ridgeia piscesae]KRT54635.1 hypothetical protein Ga0074115_10846 [endosymbiont of Ridgeia piscesae]KRT59923.1 hypothetical protein Ga0076813_16355 [endosymbiont of Ridgeia piscesae]
MTMQADSDGRVVEVEGLEVHYGNHKVLDGIDLQVNAGEIMVIMGGVVPARVPCCAPCWG